MIIKAPTSKSYAQRAVACALLADGESILHGVDMSDDTRAALDVAHRLGAEIFAAGSTFHIKGGFKPRSSEINIGESGLSTRLFTPIAALGDEKLTITGHGSILSRPMELMIEPLRALGVEIQSNGGFLPITVCGPIKGGSTVEVDGSLSSQFLTGLLTALPLVGGATVLQVKELQSKPYIDITLDVLRSFGVKIEHEHYERFYIEGSQRYKATEMTIEGDWSGASCLLVLKAISGGNFTIENLNPNSVQADRAIVEAIDLAGNDLKAFEFDATHCPDLFPALAALAAHCKGSTRIVGADRLTHKESNRAVTLHDEFAKLGIVIDISSPNQMIIHGGGEIVQGAVVDSHGDHRIAMATATAAWNRDVRVMNPDVVGKSYPLFWDDFARAVRCSN